MFLKLGRKIFRPWRNGTYIFMLHRQAKCSFILCGGTRFRISATSHVNETAEAEILLLVSIVEQQVKKRKTLNEELLKSPLGEQTGTRHPKPIFPAVINVFLW